MRSIREVARTTVVVVAVILIAFAAEVQELFLDAFKTGDNIGVIRESDHPYALMSRVVSLDR